MKKKSVLEYLEGRSMKKQSKKKILYEKYKEKEKQIVPYQNQDSEIMYYAKNAVFHMIHIALLLCVIFLVIVGIIALYNPVMRNELIYFVRQLGSSLMY